MLDRKMILNTEYNFRFDELRKNRMEQSYHKYGPVRENYGNKLISAMDNLKKRIELYEKTCNTEYLCDIANFAMIEFMYPQVENAKFDSNSYSPGLGNVTYKDIEDLTKLKE